MKRRILSIITALALCLSLCPTWALAAEADPSLCKHHSEHIGCGYTAPTEGHDCGHEHTAACYTLGVLPDADSGNPYEIGADTENRLDCHHSHNSECGYVQADPGAPCGYVCRICPIEDLIAALPEQVTEDNADDVRAQLDHILDLYRELNEDEQGQLDLSRIYALQGALDGANAPITADGHTEQQDTDEASVTINGETLYYATLEEAFAAANRQTATITMLTDAECVHSGSNGSPLNINSGTVTLNLNGNALSGRGYGGYGIIDVSGGSLLVQGEESKVKVEWGGLSCRRNGKLIVEGITLELVGSDSFFAASGIHNEGGTVILNGTQMTGAASDGQIYQYSGTTTINNVTATGTTETCPKSVCYYNEGTLTINGGTFDKIVVGGDYYSGDVQSVAELLGEGYAYKKQDGTWATTDDLAAMEISNITVKKIPLTINPDGDTSWYYSTQQTHTLAMNAAPVDSGNSVSYAWKNGAETLNCAEDAYTVPAGMPVGSYTYTCEATCDGYTLSHTFTFKIEKSGTDLTSESKVLTYNGDTLTTSFTASDTITVKATPTPTGEAPTNSAMFAASFTPPTTGQMAVFVDDTQVSEPVEAVDGSYTMTVSASDVLTLGGVEPNGDPITLTAKFEENDNMADAAGTVDVRISAVAMAKKDGEVIGYFGVSNFEGTNNLFCQNVYADATITLLGDVKPGTNSDAGTTCSTMVNITCTLDLAGHNFASTDTAIFVLPGGNLTIQDSSTGKTGNVSFIKSDGTLTLYGGTFGKIETAYTLASLLAENCAYYRGSTPILLSELEEQKELTGPVTVRKCGHTGAEATNNGNGTHSVNCPYCGYHSEHTTTLTATVSGNTVTFRGGCESCDYRAETLATAAFTIPKLTYGQTDQTVSCTWEHPNGYALMVQIDSGEELQIDVSDTQVSLPLEQLFGNPEINAGNYQLNVYCVSPADVKSDVCSLSFTVEKAPLTAEMVSLSAENVTYNGQAQEPAVTVKYGENPLTAGTDYEVSYAGNTEAGTATVTVTGKGNYTGTIEKTFEITKATLSITAPTASLFYGQKLSDSTLTGGGATNSNGDTVAGNWEWANPEEQPKATGDFSATFKPTDTKNYETPASVDVSVTVNETTPKITLTVPAHQVAGGEVTVTCTVENPHDASWKDDFPAVTLSCPGFAIENGKFTIPSETTVGTVITVTASTAAVDGKYTAGNAEATVTVTDKIPVTITGVTAQGGTYNGSTHSGYTGTPTASPYSGGFTITYATADGTALSGPPTNAGDYTVTIDLTEAAKETYAADPLVLSFSITKASATVTADSKTITKGDPAPAYTCTVSPTGANLGFAPALSCDYATDSGAGEYPITVTGAETSADGNYTITYVDGTLTVKEPSSSGGGGGGGGDTPVNVTGVSLDRNSLTLTIGESFSLTVTITPSNADDKSVTWASGNSDVASVSGGTVTATGVGTTTITVTTQSGGYTASCTVTVKAKAYTITYDANGGAGTMRTGSAADGEPFTLPGCTFTPPEGKVFDTWAIGSADGTQAKAGSSHTFTEDTTVYAVWKDAPLVTYAVTYNANGGTGTMTDGIAPDQEAFVLPECGFTAPEGKEFDCWAIGSATGPKVQPGGSFTFTADTTVYALWKDLPYDITGIVRQNGAGVGGVTVTLKQGTEIIARQTTEADGSFTFRDIPAGVYNLVAEKDGITVTVMQEITNSSANLSITLPNGNMNTEVDVKPETPPVIAGGLENIFQDEAVYTPEDKEVVDAGGTVEFKLVVEKQDASSSAAIQIEASKPAGQTIGLFLDLSIIKTVTPKDGQAETTSVTQVGSLIETLIPLPDEMQGKASYTVYREHDGIVEALPNSGNGERYTVSSDKKSITIYAWKYSTYAVAWSDNGAAVDPGNPSRPSGGGGGSVSTYAITVSKTTYGKVVSSRTNASGGSTVTLTVTPDSGYVLDTLTVTDSRGNAIKLTAQGGGKYTFTMPSRAVTVTASFKTVQTVWENPYSDVPEDAWYYEAVRFVSENGLMGGYGKSLFGPNDTLTRAQFAQILYNRAGRPVVRASGAFTDVEPGAWYADAVTWAAAEGIVSGYGGGRFGPNDPITREQLAAILWRYAGFPVPPNLLLDFPDADTASGYALDALRWAVESGVMGGYGNGQLAPKGLATRAQVAQMLMNFLKNR